MLFDVSWGKMSKLWVSRKDPFDFRRNKTRREMFVSKKCDVENKLTQALLYKPLACLCFH